LSNVARHSRASAARVFLSRFEQELRLGIEDNGVGFDVERWRNRRLSPDGCGLATIELWVETTGGCCTIEAVPRHGARVQAFWQTDPLAASAPRPQAAPASAQA
jgi:signal transduction histidine kinase